jgi:general secretion pathway protein M
MTKERTIILIIGIIVLTIGGAYRFNQEIKNIFIENDEIPIKMKRVGKYQKMISDKQLIHEKHQKLSNVCKKARNRLLRGNTKALAAVEIQNLLNKIADRSEVKIASMKVLKSKIEQGNSFLKIILKFKATGSIRGFKNMMYQIEFAKKIFTIQEARLYLPNVNNLGKLTGDFTVVGYMEPGLKNA